MCITHSDKGGVVHLNELQGLQLRGTMPEGIEKNRAVCILVYDQLCTFEYGIALEVFALPRPEYADWYQTYIVTAETGPVRGRGNIVVEADRDIEKLVGADLIIIPGWHDLRAKISPVLSDALIRAHNKGAKLVSICSGVFVLAQTGLLKGRTITTHWRYADIFQKMYPEIGVDADVLYIDDEDILTSAGSAAGLDLCLHIIRKEFGPERANEVARRLVVPAHRDGSQAQFISRPLDGGYRGRIAVLIDMLRENLDKDWSIEKMAETAGTSARTLQRRFRKATGKSPHGWLTEVRVELAKDLLETTDMNIQGIADITGLKTPETLRHHFKRLTSISPTQYRYKFSSNVQKAAQ